MRLDKLMPGHLAVIERVNQTKHQTRLNDLGFVVGVIVECWMESPLKDPRMYRLLKTSVALRNEDASQIEVKLIEDDQ